MMSARALRSEAGGRFDDLLDPPKRQSGARNHRGIHGIAPARGAQRLVRILRQVLNKPLSFDIRSHRQHYVSHGVLLTAPHNAAVVTSALRIDWSLFSHYHCIDSEGVSAPKPALDRSRSDGRNRALPFP